MVHKITGDSGWLVGKVSADQYEPTMIISVR